MTGQRRGPGRPTDRSAEQARGVLLSAARRVFAEQGYAAASTRAISDAAGMAPANLRHHLGSKAQVFAAVTDDCMGVVADRLGSIVADPALGPGDQLRALGGLLGSDPEVMAFLAVAPIERSRYAELRTTSGDRSLELEAIVQSTVDRWMSAGRLAPEVDAAALSSALVAAVFGTLAYVTRLDPGADPGATVDALARLVDGQVWAVDHVAS